MAPLSKNDAKCVAPAALLHQRQQAVLELFRSMRCHNCASFSVHRIIDTTQLLPERIILNISEHGIYMSRAEPEAFLISAPLRDIIWFDCTETIVCFEIRVSGVVQIFQFGTLHGDDICWALQKHMYNLIEECLLEGKEWKVKLDKLKKQEDYLWQALVKQQRRAEALDDADVAEMLELKEKMIKAKVESRRVRDNLKDILKDLTMRRDNALSKLEELAEANHGVEILLPVEGCSKRRLFQVLSLTGGPLEFK